LDLLEARDGQLVNRIAELRATLEREERFQSEIKNGLCPVLSEKCLNLKEGQTLDGFLKDQFSSLRSEISTLEAEQAAVSSGVSKARTARAQVATIEPLQARE